MVEDYRSQEERVWSEKLFLKKPMIMLNGSRLSWRKKDLEPGGEGG